MSQLMMNRRYWQAKITQSFKDPHYATVPRNNGLRPDQINVGVVGEHVSVVFNPSEDHVRFYAFEGQANRDRFINLYRPFGAKPCGDPLKKEKTNAIN